MLDANGRVAQRAGTSQLNLVGICVVLALWTHPIWIGDQGATGRNARWELGVASRTRRTPIHEQQSTEQTQIVAHPETLNKAAGRRKTSYQRRRRLSQTHII